MGAIVSPFTSLTIVYSTVHSDTVQIKHQSSVILAFVRGIHRWPVNSSHKGSVTRNMFPFDDVIMMYWVCVGSCGIYTPYLSIENCYTWKHCFPFRPVPALYSQRYDFQPNLSHYDPKANCLPSRFGEIRQWFIDNNLPNRFLYVLLILGNQFAHLSSPTQPHKTLSYQDNDCFKMFSMNKMIYWIWIYVHIYHTATKYNNTKYCIVIKILYIFIPSHKYMKISR